MASSRTARALVLGAAVASVHGVAAAQTGPVATVSMNRYSAYEKAAIDAALRAHHARLESAPEGKTLEGVDIVTLDVFEPRDPLPYPDFFDIFHTTSKRYVIAREVLLVPGEPYRQSLVDDSVRNLASLPQLSVVLMVPIRGSAPDRVRLLVITKDVWSLRPNWDFQLTNGGIASLSAQPAETNLAGTQTTANLNFLLDPGRVILGAGYTNLRLDGTRIVLEPNANVAISRVTGAPEGSYGGLVTGQPLFSPRSAWAWDASVSWADLVYRRFDDASVASYADTGTGQSIPFAFRGQIYDAQYTLTRSYGWSTKHDFTLGVSLARSEYTVDAPGVAGLVTPAGLPLPGMQPLNPQTVVDFTRSFVPVSDNRVGPFVQWHTYDKRYVRLLDFETLGLQEDFRLGPEAYVNLYPVTTALGSSRNFFGLDASALYTVGLKDGLVRGSVESITEIQSLAEGGANDLSDASIEPTLHVVTPTLLFGRFVYDGHLLYRYRNYLNQVSYLGGDTRLRGYPTQMFAGKDMVNSNLEFRTRSLDILTAQTGLVAFYDVGDAFSGFSQLRPYESVGVGARILFPQLDRLVARFDVGFPLGDGARQPGVTPVGFFFALGQAFSMPAIGPGGGPNSPQLSGSPTTALSPPP